MPPTEDELEQQIFDHLSEQGDPLFKKEDPPEAEKDSQPVQEQETLEEEEPEEELESEDTEDDEDTEEPEEPDAPWMPEYLDEVAAALNTTTDDLLKSIRTKTKVDGVEGEATLEEVIKNYQLNKSLTERSEAFAKQRKEFEEQRTLEAQRLQKKFEDAEVLAQTLESKVKKRVDAVDWAQLREDDPAEYVAKRQEFMEEIADIEAMKQELVNTRNEEFAKQQQEFEQQQRAYVEHNLNKLIEVLPEFKEDKTKESIKSYLKTQGVQQEEVDQIKDYRVINIAYKAMLYDQMQTKAAPAKQLAKSKPKFTKPGAAVSKNVSSDNRTKRRYKRAIKSQDVDAWADVITDRLFN